MIALKVPDSLKNEFSARLQDDGSDYGKSLGLTYCILGIVANIISQGSRSLARNSPELALGVSAVSMLMVLVAIVAGILFWVKIAGYSSQLALDPGPRATGTTQDSTTTMTTTADPLPEAPPCRSRKPSRKAIRAVTNNVGSAE